MPTPRPQGHLCERTRPSRAQAIFGSARPSARLHRAPPLQHSAEEQLTRWAPPKATPRRSRSTSTRPRRRVRVRPPPPPPHNLRAAQEFFSAKLVVGGDDKPETLLPISYWKEASEDEEATATFAYYCAEPGVKFQVKCALLRPPPEGVSYGARVYVDRGEPDTVYTSAAVEGDAEDGIDTAVPDHYFWFGPGETEYVVRGFFAAPYR